MPAGPARTGVVRAQLAPIDARTMTYPEVKKAHVIPRCYPRNFADGEQIAVRIAGNAATPKITSIDKAGTRRFYYRRTRPTGETIDDIEWSLARGERAAGYVIREI